MALFQDVVSLAMDRVASTRAVQVFRPSPTSEGGTRRPVDVFARWSDRGSRTGPKDRLPTEVLFHYGMIGTDGLSRLLDTAERYQPELRRVMATRIGRMYSSDKLLSCSAALESLDRKRSGPGRRSFKTRLGACVDLAGGPFTDLVGNPSRWLELLTKRRNHVAHHLESVEDNDGFIDIVMARSAYLLFALCVMREASLPSEVFDQFEKNDTVKSLKSQVAVVLGADLS